MATDRKWKDKEGEWKEETEWHNIAVFGATAERIAETLSKGKLVYVEGRIHYNTYEDKEGIKKTTTEIHADIIRLLEKREQSGYSDRPYSKDSSSAASDSGDYLSQTEDITSEEDIPF
jgi:single-strand DNA-binding protein